LFFNLSIKWMKIENRHFQISLCFRWFHCFWFLSHAFASNCETLLFNLFFSFLELWLFLGNCLLAFVRVMCCCCIKVEIVVAIFRRDLNFVPWGYKVEFLSLSRHLLNIFDNFDKSINKLLNLIDQHVKL